MRGTLKADRKVARAVAVGREGPVDDREVRVAAGIFSCRCR